MSSLLHDLITSSAERHGERLAVQDGSTACSYTRLAALVQSTADGLRASGLQRFTRVGVYLPKSLETVVAFFAASAGGGIFVPINPLLKPPQVGHILEDSGAEILITSAERLLALGAERDLSRLRLVVTVDEPPPDAFGAGVVSLADVQAAARPAPRLPTIDDDVVSIFYTSGSTGRPKGVVLTHRNMVVGAVSVSSYLGNTCEDSLLAVLPFSFDYGFSQLSTAFNVGARVVLLNYLLSRDVLRVAARERITGLAGVPPLWIQLAALEWPAGMDEHLRYLTNSGGKLPVATIGKLRQRVPAARLFLMYGLTEAFRSTYLSPELVTERPTSIGKAIPNAEIMVVRPDGTECGPNEPGELVHRGALVAKGYWRDEERTLERFRPAPGQLPGVPLTEIAVWSGDMVQRDEQGFLYFVGRNDELIKTSGYRVSPTEVEETLYATHLVSAAVVFGVEHATLGQSIAAVVEPAPGSSGDTEALLSECRRSLPPYMVPTTVVWESDLPRNPNGKLDRSGIIRHFRPTLEQPGESA